MNRAPCSAVIAVGFVACTFAPIWADQGGKDSEPAFDVASVKPVDTRTLEGFTASIVQIQKQISSRSLTLEPGGRWLVRAATLRSILQSVYRDDHRLGRGMRPPISATEEQRSDLTVFRFPVFVRAVR